MLTVHIQNTSKACSMDGIYLSVRFYRLFLVVTILGMIAWTPCRAESPWLLGDWHGNRPALEEAGYSFESVLTVDFTGNIAGGLSRGLETPGNLDLILTVDTGTAGWWEDGTLALYFLGNFGGDPSTRVGDFQVTSNIEAVNTFKLYEAWYEHQFLDNHLSILAGLHDYNSEFYALEYAGLFLNSSFGIGPDTAQVGPSIFSTTSIATRVAWQATDNFYLMGAIYDGVSGDPDDPHGTHIIFKNSDGLFYGVEAGLLPIALDGDNGYYKLAIGAWYHTVEFEDFAGNSREDNYGVYFIGEKRFFSENDSAQGLGVFVQLGLTREDRNQVDTYVGAGFNYTGLIPGRDKDVFGVAVAHARNGNNFLAANPGTDRAETTVEVSYLMEIFPWLRLQPDAHYVINPGMDSSIDDAVVLGMRLQIDF